MQGGSLKIKKYPTSREILDLLESGFLLAVLWTSPVGGAELLKHFSLKLLNKVWEKYDQRRLRQSIKRMVDRKLLKIQQKEGETTITVAEKGRRLLLRYNLEKMQLEKPAIWDRKWRVVIFDILENKKSLRNALREKIKLLGLYQLQKSVFITPYPCEKEISFLRQYFEVGNEVSVFTAMNLEEEEFLKKKFCIK